MTSVGIPSAGAPVDAEFTNAMKALRSRSRWSAALVLLVSFALFILVRQPQSGSTRGLVVLVGVLLFHELGHYAGMRLFGYRDVRMFFIPFFGAAVSGRRGNVAPWKEGVVLLLGPVPGIAVAFALAMKGAIASPAVRPVAFSLVTINAFNLLPLAGLDGARLLQHVLFSRRRWLEILFQLCAALAMAAIGIKTEVWALLAFAYLMLVTLPLRWRVLGAASRLRVQGISVPIDARDLDGETARAVFREAHGALQWDRGSKRVAAVMDQVVDSVNARPPSLRASAALAAAWVLSLVLAVVTFVLLVTPRPRSDEPRQAAPLTPGQFHLQLRPPKLLEERSSGTTTDGEPR
jgi:Zn-dependent protease